MKQLKIGTSWVRGVVGEALTPELAVSFACAFATWCDGGLVVIGRDTRRTSDMFRSAVVSGLLSAGCQILDLGVCATPQISYYVRKKGAAGGISITGSHNSAAWNALKFVGPHGALLNAVNSEELLDIWHASAFLLAPWDELKPVETVPGGDDGYLRHLLEALDVKAIRDAHLRVAVDYCNGACVDAGNRLLEALGCHVFSLNDDQTGEFAHAPAPSASNMRQVGALMRCVDADLGVAINVDGDRIGFVCADGKPLSEEYTFPLVARQAMKHTPGRIVTNLSTSSMVDRVAQEFDQPVIRTFVGEGYVVDRAMAEGAAVVGEGCGAVTLLPHSTTFDGLLAMGIVLEAMATSGKRLDELADSLPKLHMRKGEISLSPDLTYRVLQGFRALYADRDPDCTDGVRVDWEDAWLHVRGSNTEPLLRVIAEAATADWADALFDDAMAYARRLAARHEGA